MAKTGRKITHGNRADGKRTPEYVCWDKMVQRCTNPNSHNYKYYGGAGVTICDRWLGENGFKHFLEDMGVKPSKSHSLDRYPDNKGIYTKSNCRWATQKEQQNNKTNNRIILFNGKSQTLSQWAEELQIPKTTLSTRLKAGHSLMITTKKIKL